MASISPVPKLQFFDDDGNPLAGGKLYTYAAGTTDLLATYTTAAGNVPHANPIILDSRGEVSLWLANASYDFALYDENDVLVYTQDDITVDSASIVNFSITNGPSGTVQDALDGLIFERTAAEIAAGVTPTNYYFPPGDIRRYGAVADGLTNVYTALTNSINSNDYTIVPSGEYAIGAMAVITAGRTVELQGEVTITRLTSLSASTDPVIWVKETGASLIGYNRHSTKIATQNRSPKGVVRVGLEDETETGRIVRNCRVAHLRLNGSTGDGQTSGDPDVNLYVPCASAEINYYHTIDDIMCADTNHGIWLHGESNAHNISRVFGESMGNASMDGVLLYFQGGSDCTVSQAFMSGNGGGGAGAILLKFSNLGASRSTHNHISGIVGEMGVSGLLVESTDSGASAPVSNHIIGVDNSGGINVNDDFWNNNFASLNDFPSTKGGFRFPSTASLSASAFVLDYYAETQSYSTNPTIDSSTPGTGRSTTVNHAKWTRIGNVCFVSLRVTMTTLGSGGAGNVRIKNGMPFACISDGGNYLGGMEVPNYENLAASVRTIKAAAFPGTSDIAIYITTADATTNTQMDFATYVQATTQFYVTGFYIVA